MIPCLYTITYHITYSNPLEIKYESELFVNVPAQH